MGYLHIKVKETKEKKLSDPLSIPYSLFLKCVSSLICAAVSLGEKKDKPMAQNVSYKKFELDLRDDVEEWAGTDALRSFDVLERE